ncbi:hypothetical protein EV363DRAFT_1328030 [Boletus edulis]|uniref:Uncharacterized protein n=1 Tax=Boletus edulis BED1 TaxID=1328754 RepID=A0AAD4B9G9_BOLED|nr:hypothetical protein EV363DRAFT_1328030 [Boletus edulis]KAF8414886.1 hypothetical protein L210DRAFT_3589448 [Boletus edulis BED1]
MASTPGSWPVSFSTSSPLVKPYQRVHLLSPRNSLKSRAATTTVPSSPTRSLQHIPPSNRRTRVNGTQTWEEFDTTRKNKQTEEPIAKLKQEGLGPGNGEVVWLELDLIDPAKREDNCS